MDFESMLEKQKQDILSRFQQVYHLPLDRSEQDFQNSAFYKLLMNPDTNLWRDDTEENFSVCKMKSNTVHGTEMNGARSQNKRFRLVSALIFGR